MYHWLTTRKDYEGFPLLLRRPTNLDINALRLNYPRLIVVTHEFAKQQSNGLPEAAYNDSLANMDLRLACSFDVDQMGVPVLIETFGGTRHYYFYAATDAEVNATITPIRKTYPHEQLTWSIHPDPEWGFIERYAREHF
jgi:hypothetical protein